MAKQVPQVYGDQGAPKMTDGSPIPGQKFTTNPTGFNDTTLPPGSEVTGFNTVQQGAVKIVQGGRV